MNEDFDRARRDQTQFRIYRYEEPIAKSLLDENPFGWALREIERKHERDIDRMRAVDVVFVMFTELFLLNFQMFMVRHNRQTMKLLDPGLVTLTTLVVLTLLPTSNSELYTALADMEALLETEAVLIDTLHGYIKAQEQRLATLRRRLEISRIQINMKDMKGIGKSLFKTHEVQLKYNKENKELM
ncbi:hypothetical protein PV325_001699 [Microctonus aethiopoides]|nr:hypothetical protein PV325_001699 [Microctonus aethiopoides]